MTSQTSPNMHQEVDSILAVIQGYFDMLYTADCAAVDGLFFPEAHVQSMADGAVVTIDIPGFKQRLTGRPVPADRHELRDGELMTLDFAGPACAYVKLRSTMLDKLFIDYLTMLKADGQWRIISKVFHAEATPETTQRPAS